MSKQAGEFSTWLEDFQGAMEGKRPGNVPCGDCIGCCTSSKFILVRPTDTKAKSKIPHSLLFPAPGLAKDFLLLGYDENGHCPMLVDGKCSIYDSRPETCRQYDCRVLAATGAEVKEESEVITQRINDWEFSFDNKLSHQKASAVKQAMTFLKQNRKLFPHAFLPHAESQLSAFAIRICSEFEDFGTDFPPPAKMVNRIVEQY